MQFSLQAAYENSILLEEHGDILESTRAILDDPVNQDNRVLFFAKVLRSATEEEVRRLFGRFGKVSDVNLFRAFQGAPTTKGCGLVTMGSHAEAMAAIAALDSNFVWDGMETPMVVKWMDTALQRRRREQHLANMRQALSSSGGMGYAPGGLSLATTLPSAPHGSGLMHNSFLDALEPTETPPPGCAADAIKLFVGNVPKSCTEEQLLPLFQSVGKVVELVIVHDRATHESKGSAFVWYATRVDAERAILQFNFRHVLPDPSGDQDRPLVVRRAKTRAKPLKHSALLGPMTGQMATSQLGIPSSQLPSVGAAQPYYMAQAGSGLMSGLEALSLSDTDRSYGQLAGVGSLGNGGFGGGGGMGSGIGGSSMAGGGMGGNNISVSGIGSGGSGGPGSLPYRSLPGLGGQLLGMSTASAPVSMSMPLSMYSSYANGDAMLGDLSLATTANGQQLQANSSSQLDILAQQQSQQNMAQSMTLNQQQLSVLNTHLFSMQTVSGAQLHISPGPPGLVNGREQPMFNLVVSGTKSQVETAKSLVTTVLSHS